jgi:hypothetical protein
MSNYQRSIISIISEYLKYTDMNILEIGRSILQESRKNSVMIGCNHKELFRDCMKKIIKSR